MRTHFKKCNQQHQSCFWEPIRKGDVIEYYQKTGFFGRKKQDYFCVTVLSVDINQNQLWF